MKYEVYGGIAVTEDFGTFDFISCGRNGNILKRVAFTQTEDKGVYNLALGDVDEDNEIDDLAITDNGDRNVVIATVVFIVEAYTRRFPERRIAFRGSTAERTRLYRMVISIYFEELSALYEIWGYVGDERILFAKGMNARGFEIFRKSNKFGV
jgi:hypothetical protein